MKRYSIAPTSSRRKSAIDATLPETNLPARQILEQLDQDTTFVLQEIDKNISRANTVINDKIKPMIQEYALQSWKVWENTGFWKHFFEQSANVELDSYVEPINEVNPQNNFLLLNEIEKNKQNGRFDDSGMTNKTNQGNNENNDIEDDLEDKEEPEIAFKKPNLRQLVADGNTPTWSTEHTKPSMKSIQLSPPKRMNPNNFTGGQVRENTKLTDSITLEPPALSAETRAITSSPHNRHNQHRLQSRESPIKIHTIRQSLDTYHRVSISPKKLKTPIRSTRTSRIESILNSSPILPEPPILQSEIGSETPKYMSSSSPRKEQQQQQQQKQKKRESLNLHSDNDQQQQQLQRFPNTPKYSRLSGSSVNSLLSNKSNLSDDDEDDHINPPPQLDSHNHGVVIDNSDNNHGGDAEDSSDDLESLPVPELNTIDLKDKNNNNNNNNKRSIQSTPRSNEKKRRTTNNNNNNSNDDDDDMENVFLDHSNKKTPDNQPSNNSTTRYFSTGGNNNSDNNADNDNDNHTETQDNSKSFSQIYDEAISKIRGKKSTIKNDGNRDEDMIMSLDMTMTKDLTSGEYTKDLSKDLTENSTTDLGPFKERWKKLTRK
ncbi:conserved hypothetical protein [Candida dubliniensis CD36]|uniref:DASH complex subunit ASK1 n=1 Tax=Candida dubliniensis (strain CD36 / ATCC MYA-646 / CBS 7987 / NCPF 3949 / NRRL Y-17841) TaxID=573826 RepID=B9WFH9_CANDC|nr:conserved hypothetical protein [Candida dubliniensis CD36]CAX41998.1 conserved hypothetical protein [Candida dubliniensis CD36]